MTMYASLLIILLAMLALSNGFQMTNTSPSRKLSVFTGKSSALFADSRDDTIKLDNQKVSTNEFMQSVRKISVLAASALVSLPTVALADDANQNAFLVPLGISVLTMVPFIYYANALQPKERAVRQIEVDPRTLKAVNPKDQDGSTAEARARKK
jgi:hypothetical protein